MKKCIYPLLFLIVFIASCSNQPKAVAVLGIIKGMSGLPVAYQDAVKAMGDSLLIHTSYSFNKAVKRTMEYAQEFALKNGGKVNDESLMIKVQAPVAFPMEDAFPKLALNKRVTVSSKEDFIMTGKWNDNKNNQAKFSNKAGDEISFTFEGTSASIEGNWVKDGGKADVFVDDVFNKLLIVILIMLNKNIMALIFITDLIFLKENIP